MRAAASLALAILSMSVITDVHAAESLSTAQAYISNLSYRLVDLDPDDGITPGIVFGVDPSDPSARPYSGYFGYFPVNGEANGFELHGNAPFSSSGGSGASSPLWGSEYGGATATHEIGRFGLEQKLATTPITQQELTTGALSTGFREWFLAYTPYQLTANTELIIEGTLTQSLQVDPLAFASDPKLSAALKGLRGHSKITFNVSGETWETPAPYENTVDLDYEIDALGGLTTSSVLGTSASKTWSVKVSNASNSALRSTLLFNFEATTTAVGVVPEPSAWAMLFVGLGMIGVASRRRPTAGPETH